MKKFKVFIISVIAVILSLSVTNFYNNKLQPDIAAKNWNITTMLTRMIWRYFPYITVTPGAGQRYG